MIFWGFDFRPGGTRRERRALDQEHLGHCPAARNSSKTRLIGSDATVQYASNRERLEAWDGPEAIKQKFAAQVEERYQREREPYVQWLADLQNRAITIMAPQVTGRSPECCRG